MYRCAQCGGARVQQLVKAWYDLNEDRLAELDELADVEDPGSTWCDDCEDHTDIVAPDAAGPRGGPPTNLVSGSQSRMRPRA